MSWLELLVSKNNENIASFRKQVLFDMEEDREDTPEVEVNGQQGDDSSEHSSVKDAPKSNAEDGVVDHTDDEVETESVKTESVKTESLIEDGAKPSPSNKELRSGEKGGAKEGGSESELGATSGDMLSDDETTKRDDADGKSGEKSGVGLPLLIIGLLGVLCAVVFALKPSPSHQYNTIDMFEKKLTSMKADFPQQDELYWNMLRNGGRKHLKKVHGQDKRALEPQAYLIAGYSGSAQTFNCFVKRLAATFHDGHADLHASNFVGSSEENHQKLYEQIISNLKGSNKLLIIHGIEKLDFKVAQLFMSFADSYNRVATYPQSMILFTTELPLSFEASQGRVLDEGEVGNHFKNVVWRDAHPDLSAPLWSRVGDGLMLIRSETELPAVCS